MGFLSSFRGENRSSSSQNSDYLESTHLSQGASVIPRIKSESFPKKQDLYGTQAAAAEQCESIPGQTTSIKMPRTIYQSSIVCRRCCVYALASHSEARHVQGPSITDWC